MTSAQRFFGVFGTAPVLIGFLLRPSRLVFFGGSLYFIHNARVVEVVNVPLALCQVAGRETS